MTAANRGVQARIISGMIIINVRLLHRYYCHLGNASKCRTQFRVIREK